MQIIQHCYVVLVVMGSFQGALAVDYTASAHADRIEHAASIVDRAKAVENSFKNLAKIIARKLHISKDDIKFGDIKKIGDMVCKAEREKGGDVDAIKDVLRVTLEVQRQEQIDKAVGMLSDMQQGKLKCLMGVKAYNIQNTFNDARYNGYKVLKANFVVEGFDATEIQIRFPADDRQLDRSHEAYKVVRACDHAMATFGNLGARLSEAEKGEIAWYLAKRQRHATAQRERCNVLAFTTK